MYKYSRILNKNTNENFYGQIDTEFEGQDFYELVEIPDDGKDYISDDTDLRGYKEKPVDLDALKQQKTTDIQNAYTNAFLNGLDSSIGIKFHIKPEDQLNYIGAMIAAASLQDTDTLPYSIIDFNGAVHQITKGQASTAYIEIVNYKAQIELARANLLVQVTNAQSPEDIPTIPEILTST